MPLRLIPHRVSLFISLMSTTFASHLTAAETPPQITSLTEASLLESSIGESVRLQVETDQPVDDFKAKGLPPGLTIAADGLIMGRPTRCQPIDPATGLPRPYQVTFTARNTGGVGPATTVQWRIYPLLPPGTHEGLLDEYEPNEYVSTYPPAGLKLTLGATGGISGQLSLMGKIFRFTKLTPVSAGESGVTAETIINRGRDLPPLTLVITTAERFPRKASLRLHDPEEYHLHSGYERSGTLQKQAFDKQHPATAYAGAYNLAIQIPDEVVDDGDGPHGISYLLGKISSTGVFTYRGRTADGYTLTGSHVLTLSGDDQPLRVAFYKTFKPIPKLSSVPGAWMLGWLEWPGLASLPTALRVSGTLNWLSGYSGDSFGRTDDLGFECDPEVTGGLYQPPAADTLIMGLPLTRDNVSVQMRYGYQQGLATQQTFTLEAKHRVKLPPHRDEHPILRLSFNVKQGTFKGTLRYPHENPKLVMESPFEGILHSPTGPGEGFFALPSYSLPPHEPESIPRRAPRFSARIRLTPAVTP